MRTSRRGTVARFTAMLSLGALVLGPAALPVTAAAPVVLTVGTTQDFDSANPYQSALVSSYEAFQLTYDLLVGFGAEAEPAPAYADSWVRSADKVTFHIRSGMQWSDGTPATSADACFSW